MRGSDIRPSSRSKHHTTACRIKYYNNVLFHNVQQNFIAQSGDPTGTGTGGDSIYGYIPIPCAECGLKKGKGGMALLMVCSSPKC